jgi:ferritin-like metal-binding protein YciE
MLHHGLPRRIAVDRFQSISGAIKGQKLLQTTLKEEAETDQKLTHLAKSSINLAAAE